MTTINLVNSPEEKFLRTTCTEVTDFGEVLKTQISHLMEVANEHRSECAGLSMNQIWKLDGAIPRVFITQADFEWEIFINPKITRSWNKTIKEFEGCLSVPKVLVKKERARHIRVEYIDKNFNKAETELYDFAARVFQHELDHLDGKTFLDE